MQIRLTISNEELLGVYRELCRLLLPLYNEADGTVANTLLEAKLKEEIKRMKERKK